MEYFGVIITEPGEPCLFCGRVNDKSQGFLEHTKVHKENFDKPECEHDWKEKEAKAFESNHVEYLYLKCHCGNEQLKWKPK
jgi:hypothetical protein